MRECRGHSVVFEAAGGIHALVLEPERAGIEADVAADLVGLLEQGLAFADGDDLVGRLANGSSSRNRQTPEKASGSWRVAHFASKSASRRGTGSVSHW